MQSVELRPYQTDCLHTVVSHFKAGQKRVLLQMPTGAGKTEFAMKLIKGVIDKNQIVFWVTHRIELVNQIARRLRLHDCEPSFIASGMPWNNTAQVQICSVQTLCKKVKGMSDAQRPHLVVFDEAHHISSKSYQTVLSWLAVKPPFQLGLTATPRRLDRKPLAPFFDVMVQGPTIQTLIDNGWLCQPSLYVPPKSANYIESIRDELHTTAGDYSIKDLDATFLGNQLIYGDAIEHYEKLSGGQPAIVFCTSVKHCHEAAAEFTAHGINSSAIDGSMARESREKILQDLETHQIRCIMSCDLVSEGFDLPVLGCAILLRPTQSLTVYLQQIGRCMRPSPGKTEAIIIDHVNNSYQHAAPWINRHWSLDSYGAPEKTEELTGVRLKLCNKCGNYIPVGDRICAACGNNLPLTTKEKKAVKVIQTQLIKLTPGQVLYREQRRMLKTLDDFVQFATEKGYTDAQGWANKAFAQKAIDDKVYFQGDKVALVELFTRRKKANPELEATNVLAKRAEFKQNSSASGSQGTSVFMTGTYDEVLAYAKKNNKERPEVYARAAIKRRPGVQNILDTGSLTQVMEVAKLLGITGNAASYAETVIANRGVVKGAAGAGSAAVKPKKDYDSSLAYALGKVSTVNEDGTVKDPAAVQQDAERFARNIILKDNRAVIETGTLEQVLAIVNTFRLNNPEAFAAKILSNRLVGAVVTAPAVSADDDFFS